MKVFLYSPSTCLALLPKGETVKVDQNPKTLEYTDGIIEFYFGEDYERSRVDLNFKYYENIEIIDLYEGFLCIPRPKRKRNLAFRELFSTSLSLFGAEFNFKVFCNGACFLKISAVRTEKLIELPFTPLDLSANLLGSNLVLTVLKGSPSMIKIFSTKDLEELFSGFLDGFKVEDTFKVLKFHKGIGSHKETDEYSFDGKFNLIGKNFASSYPYDPIPSEVIPYAFLEKVRLSADYRDFLSPDLKKDLPLIKDFFGDFSYVLPPFEKAFKDNVLLVGDKVRFLKIQTEKDLVSNFEIENFPF